MIGSRSLPGGGTNPVTGSRFLPGGTPVPGDILVPGGAIPVLG